jgi:thiamine biosynthesis lipoprotein
MGSFYTAKIVAPVITLRQQREVRIAVDQCLAEVNRQMSHYQTNSELSAFNRWGTDQPFRVSPGFARVTRYALELGRRTGGLVDVTLAPLINLWGFGQRGEIITPPTEAEVQTARQQFGYRWLEVTTNGMLRKHLPGLQLNLSAVAAGHAADQVADLLRSLGHTNFFLDITGEMVLSGHNPSGQPWRIGIQQPDPDLPQGQAHAAIVALTDRALATSGNYRKFFQDAAGNTYSHILNPRTGRPVTHRLASVTVLADTCLEADGLSTALFVMGPEEGLKWIETQPRSAAFFIIRNPQGGLERVASRRFPAWIDPAVPAK